MKAVILAGGEGTRLRPLTCNTPKPMIPLVNQPFIEYMIENMRDQGITEVILAVQYLAERFREALGDGSRLGVKVHIVEEPEPRGLGLGLWIVRSIVERHGGRIAVSRPDDARTRFTLTLPVAAEGDT